MAVRVKVKGSVKRRRRSEGEGVLEERGVFEAVEGEGADGGGGGGIAPGVEREEAEDLGEQRGDVLHAPMFCDLSWHQMTRAPV